MNFLKKFIELLKNIETSSKKKKKIILGVLRESNSRPLAPEARIIPLDQTPFVILLSGYFII